MGPRCSSAETQVCHRSYIIAARYWTVQDLDETIFVKNSYRSTFGSYIKELLVQKYWQLISTKQLWSVPNIVSSKSRTVQYRVPALTDKIYFFLSELVSERVSFNANSATFQLYHGENKLIFIEMMMRSALY
jgi:hypothetical protein